MMNLMKENEENRKRMALSIITGVITIIAVCALITIASFLDLPAVVRIILIVFSVAVAAAGITAVVMLDNELPRGKPSSIFRDYGTSVP